MSKGGFERTETYGYDANGYHIRTEVEQLGTLGTTVDTIERDVFGRAAVTRNFQSDGTLINKSVAGFDIYNNQTKTEKYSSETQVSSILTQTFDEYNRVKTGWEDKNGNKVFDAGDTKYVLHYSDNVKDLVVRRENTRVDADGAKVYEDYNYVYDQFTDKKVREFIDLNNNQKVDDNEKVTHITLVGDTDFVEKFEYSYGLDKSNIYAKWHFVFPDAGVGGEHIAGIRTELNPAQSYIKYGVHGPQFTTKDDYTTGNWAKLLEAYKGKIHVAYLTNENANTEITIDKQVIANLAPGKEFTIFGDKTDTVNLKNGSDFVKKVGTVEIGGQTFDQYTTEVDGQSYTLRLDSDINVVLA